MSQFNEQEARAFLTAGGKNHVIGWQMTPEEAERSFRLQRKTVLTFFGYSVEYEDEAGMLEIASWVLARCNPAVTFVNMGATQGGIGAVYPMAKKLGFTTTGIVSRNALEIADEISPFVDHICFIADTEWGGEMPNGALYPTSEAMVRCSDWLVGIGGGPISRDEMLAGRKRGKPVKFFPADISHLWAMERAKKRGQPPPISFSGEAHEVFAAKTRSSA